MSGESIPSRSSDFEIAAHAKHVVQDSARRSESCEMRYRPLSVKRRTCSSVHADEVKEMFVYALYGWSAAYRTSGTFSSKQLNLESQYDD